MRRSASRSAATSQNRRRNRLIGAAGAIVVFGAIIGVSQFARADETDAQTKVQQINGLEVLARSCEEAGATGQDPATGESRIHDGFQKGDKCVETQFGELSSAANNPTLLITESPKEVGVNQPFSFKVSTRNLVRDRFLGAAAGGYYLETSLLTQKDDNGNNGIYRGHFHNACRSLKQLDLAPNNPQDDPEFFVATEDKNGGRDADVLTIDVPGLPTAGVYQCSSWAGDGSHRIPMMERAKQTPAFDSFRLVVGGGDDQGQGGENGDDQGQPGDDQNQGGENGDDQGQPGDDQGQGGENGDDQGQGGENGDDQGQPGDDQNQGGDDQNQGGQPGDDQNQGGDDQNQPGDDQNPAGDDQTPAGDDQNQGGGGYGGGERFGGFKTESTALKAPAKAAKPKAAAPAAKTENEPATADVEPADVDAGQPQAEPAANNATDSSGGLAKTGVNTLAIMLGGVVIIALGFVVFGATRRNRPRSNMRY